MQVKRYANEQGTFDFELIDNSKRLFINFSGNLDLYFIFVKSNDFFDNKFKITKENMTIYNAFLELIEAFKEPRLHKVSQAELNFFENKEDEMNLYLKAEELNKNLKKQNNYKELYNDAVISWHSDDYPYDVSDVVLIYRKDEDIVLEFSRNKVDKIGSKNVISIRFRNSRSHYKPFNCFFMDMYNKLNSYDPDFHQIHIEEVVYTKKMKHN